MVSKLKYGNTNTFFIRGTGSNLLIDMDYVGTMSDQPIKKQLSAFGGRLNSYLADIDRQVQERFERLTFGRARGRLWRRNSS